MRHVVVGLATLALAARTAGADELPDLDGDGDVDADDRALLDAAEIVEIHDKSEGAKLGESARAVTVIDLRRARERSADLGEVLSRNHGLQVRRSGGLGSAARLSLGGLVDEQIRFFLDGVPLRYAGFGLGVANVPADLLQRVDVYRGVVPISLGADALGGAIDLVTDPSWVSRAAVSYQVGSFGTHRLTLAGRARDAGTGLALGVATFFDRARNDYPIDVEVTNAVGQLEAARVRRFHDAYTAGGAIVEAGVVAPPAATWVERATLRLYDTRYAKELQHNVVMTVPYGEATYGGESRGATADGAVAAGGWRARLVGGVARATTDFRDVSPWIYDWYGDRVRERPVGGETGARPTDQRVIERAVFARALVERRAGAHAVRLALAPTLAHRSGVDHLDTNPDGRDPIEARRDTVQLVGGAEYELRALGDRLENIAFAKLYHLGVDAETARAGGVFADVTTSRTLPGAGDSLRLRVRGELYVKASYEWATRLPSSDELFGDGVLISPSPALQPERSHNVNLGAQVAHEGRTGAWTGELAGFARLADQLIVLLGTEQTLKYDNVYAARIAGVEGSAGWTAPDGWAQLVANATVQDIRNASDEGTFGRFDGDRIPNRPWLLASLEGSLRTRDLLRANDELMVFGASRYVHGFYRGWESQGLGAYKQVIPRQLAHGVGVTYAARGTTALAITFEVQNLTDARVFDSFGVQKPGRAFSLKVSGEL